MYNMSIVYSLDLSSKSLNMMTELIDNTHYVTKNAATCTITQSLPSVPTKELLEKYAAIIKEQYTNTEIKVENVSFSHFAKFEYEPDPDSISNERLMEIIGNAMDLMIQQIERDSRKITGYDPEPAAVEDILKSDLQITTEELDILLHRVSKETETAADNSVKKG